MSHQAQVQLAGRTVADPRKISKDDSERFHVVVRIAINNGYFDSTGEWVAKNTTFLDVNCWGNLAKNVLISIGKGTPVIVLGKMETRSWESTNDQGQTVPRSALSVYASHIGPDLNEREVQVYKAKRTADGAESSAADGAKNAEPAGNPEPMSPAPASGDRDLALAGSAEPGATPPF